MQMSGHSSVCVCTLVWLQVQNVRSYRGFMLGPENKSHLTKVTQENQLEHFHRDRANRLLSCPILSLSCDKVDFFER